MYRNTYVEIDCEELKNNIVNIKNNFDYKYYIGVVKADCYHHGINSIKYMIDGGINYLATSSLEEALEIRKTYKDIPILILEPIHYEDCIIASKNNITICIDNIELFNKLKDNKIKIKFHLKIDSGMNRFGLKNKDYVKYIFDNYNKTLYMEGIYTHLSTGIGDNFEKELNTFKKLTSLIDITKIDIIHIDRSLTLEQHNKINFTNGIRLGIIMYGIKKEKYILSWKRKLYNKIFRIKDNYKPSVLNTKTVFKFYTEVIEIKEVGKNEVVGYGGMYNSTNNIKIALLPYGFADYLYINKSYVYINNKKYNIICNYMDVTTVLIDDNVKIGDKVEIFGDNISIRTASKLAGQNVYKTLCAVTNRVPRIYKGE